MTRSKRPRRGATALQAARGRRREGRAEREARVIEKLDELERTNPAKYDEMIKLLARLVVEDERERTEGSP